MLNNVLGVLSTPTPPVTNSYESIQTFTVGSGGSADITFSSIPSTYKHLQIRSLSRSTYATQDAFKIQYNGDTSASYSYHYLGGNGSSTYAGNATSASFMQGAGVAGQNSGGAFGGCIFDVLDYTSTNKRQTIRSLGGFDSNGAGVIEMWSGAFYPTTNAAISSIKLFMFNGNFVQYSSFALYGIKG